MTVDAPDAPTLTEETTPCPGVEVYFPTLDADAVRITVWRVADGVTETVRGADNERCEGDFRVVDWGVPFGVTSTYAAEIFDAGGASVSGAQATIQVDRDEVWFQDQVDPETSFMVSVTPESAKFLAEGAAEQISRTRKTATQIVFGKYRPFLQDFGLGALEGVPMDVWTDTDQGLQQMLALQKVTPILVRTPPMFAALPRLLSANVANPTARPMRQIDNVAHLWSLKLDEVEPVAKAIIRPLVTWSDWEAAFPSADYTWADVEAIYSAGTWTDAVRNSPNA